MKPLKRDRSTVRETGELVVEIRTELKTDFRAATVQDQLALLLARAAMQD